MGIEIDYMKLFADAEEAKAQEAGREAEEAKPVEKAAGKGTWYRKDFYEHVASLEKER